MALDGVATSEEETYWFISIFWAGIDEEDFRGRIILATPAANTGIDNHLVTLIIGVGWFRNLCTYFQQCGRGGRNPTMQPKFLQLGCIQSHVSLVFQTYRLPTNAEAEKQPPSEVNGLSYAVSPVRKKVASHHKETIICLKARFSPEETEHDSISQGTP